MDFLSRLKCQLLTLTRKRVNNIAAILKRRGFAEIDPLDQDEPERLAQTIALMKLNYVVITSVDRDDLHDGGAGHFVQCIQRIRALAPATNIEILTPDFGGRPLLR